MSREINLITKIDEISSVEQKVRDIVKKWIPSVLVIFTLILAITLGISFYLRYQLRQVAASIDNEKTQIGSLAKNEGMYILLKQKADAIHTIMTHHYPYVNLYNFFQSQTNPDLQLLTVLLSESGAVQINVQVKSSDILDNYINRLLDEGGKLFHRIELISIQLKPEAYYDVTFEISTSAPSQNIPL